jgi:peptidoglycan/xylan/chitin deacetylase (PgdA/CDA1 family)
MTVALITVDTELSLTSQLRGATAEDNFRSAYVGATPAGDFGVPYQLARLQAYGLKAVFFVEALCTEILGLDILKRMAEPILEGGHEVQLHVHPEWLWWAEGSLRLDRRFQSLADLDYATQRSLLERALEAFGRAKLPVPTAFRAGNFGANGDTLSARSTAATTNRREQDPAPSSLSGR